MASSRERLEELVELGKMRWAQTHNFDLDPQTWAYLFSQYQAGTVLEAVKLARTTRDPDPAKAYAYFMRCIDRMAAKYETHSTIQN